MPKKPFDLFSYPNGLRLLTVPMENTESVMVLVLVATGSRYETREINGISHFLEHLMFRGTEKRPEPLDIPHELDSIGAEYNAFTTKEYTGYHVKCSSDKIDVALDVISDIFQNSRFDENEMNKERGPIKEEINMYFDDPVFYTGDLYDNVVFGDQPLGWNIAGPKENIDAISRNDILNYFNSHYFARSTVVCVAGKINPEIAKEKVAKYFNKVRESQIQEPIPAFDDQKIPRIKIAFRKTDQTQISLGFRSYGYMDPRIDALKAMSFILGGTMSSRLFTEIRVKRGLAYHIEAGASAYKETGDFGVAAGLNNDNLLPALRVIIGEQKKLLNELVSEKELTRMKDHTRGRLAIGLETSNANASFYGCQELLEHRILTPEEKLEKIMAVTREDIMEVAKDIIKPERANLVVVGPFKEDDPDITNIINSW